MRRIAVMNKKGGTGKTTVATTVAVGLARKGRRVLLLDLDEQAHSTKILRPGLVEEPGMYELIASQCESYAHDPIAFADVLVRIEDRLDLVPSSNRMVMLQGLLPNEMSREGRLRSALSGIGGYDFVLVDFPPSLSVVAINGLVVCDEAWIVTSCEYLGLEGVAEAVDALAKMRRAMDKEVRVSAVIPNCYEGNTVRCRTALGQVKEAFGELVTPPIRRSTDLGEAPGHHLTIWDYRRQSNGYRDFDRLVDHLLDRKEAA